MTATLLIEAAVLKKLELGFSKVVVVAAVEIGLIVNMMATQTITSVALGAIGVVALALVVLAKDFVLMMVRYNRARITNRMKLRLKSENFSDEQIRKILGDD
jgi:hypothetical protein